MRNLFYIILTASSLLFISESSKAQAYKKGDVLLSAGASFGYLGYRFGGYGSRIGFSVPVTANLEIGVHELISVGPYIGFHSSRYGNSNDRYSVLNTSIGARASVHLTSLLNKSFEAKIDADKIDFYVGILAGYALFRSDYLGTGVPKYDRAGIARSGVFLGGRYYLSNNLGLFGEVGYGVFGLGTFGITLKI